MQIFNFPKVYSDLAISLLDDKNVDKVEIRPKSDYCNIITTKEGDIVELIDQFGGLILHRENRLAFKVELSKADCPPQ